MKIIPTSGNSSGKSIPLQILQHKMDEASPEEKLYINADEEIVRAEKNPDPKKFGLIPKQLGVMWADDQSNNEIVIGVRIRGADYVFESRQDEDLTRQYADQLAALVAPE